MERSYKPQGYSSVSAYVVADGAQDVIDFLIKSFDARQTRRYDMPDVDASYRRSIDAGGLPVEKPKQREGDPDRRAGVKDPAGNTWWIATQVS